MWPTSFCTEMEQTATPVRYGAKQRFMTTLWVSVSRCRATTAAALAGSQRLTRRLWPVTLRGRANITGATKAMRDPFLARRIVTLIEGTRINVTTEAASHQAISDALTKEGIEHECEVRLSATDRIDILAGEVGIEVKVGHQKRRIAKQLNRYSEHEQIGALILATGRAWPGQFYLANGTPFLVASLTKGWL